MRTRPIAAALVALLSSPAHPFDASKASRPPSSHPSRIGAAGDGATDDRAAFQAALDTAIAAGRKSLTLSAASVYALTAGATASDGTAAALVIRNAADFTLDCAGSTLALKAPAAGSASGYGHILRVENSVRVTVDRCGFDYVNLPLTQGTLASVDTAAKTATFTLDPALPVAWSSVQHIEGFNTATGLSSGVVLAYTGGNRAATVLGNSLTVDFSATGDQPKLAGLTPGSSYLLERQYYNANAVSADAVDGLTVRRSPIYAAAGAAIRGFNNRDVLIDADSGPRLKPGRWRSVTADGIHLGDTRGTVVVRNSLIEGTGDDGLNVYANARTVASVSGAQFTIPQPVNAANETIFTYAWRVGDTLTFVGTDGGRLGTAAVSALSPSGATLTVTTPSLPAGTAAGGFVYNSSTLPMTSVTGNRIRLIRGMGVRFQAERGEVRGNAIDRTTDEAISVGGYGWTLFNEGGVPLAVSVTDNAIVNANNGGSNAPAAITAYRYNLALSAEAPAGTLGAIVIRGNRVRGTYNMCVYVTSIAALDLGGNTCEAWAQSADLNAWRGMGDEAFGVWNIAGGRIGPNTLLNPGAAARKAESGRR